MSNHAPEPWFPADPALWGGRHLIVGDRTALMEGIAGSSQEANISRAVACVNGLANVSNPNGIQAVVECAWDLALNGDPDPGRVGMLTQRLLSALEFAGAKVAE